MRSMDIMDALGFVPLDFINHCISDTPGATDIPEALDSSCSADPLQHQQNVPAESVRTDLSSAFRLTRKVSLIAVAACLAFAAGAVYFISSISRESEFINHSTSEMSGIEDGTESLSAIEYSGASETCSRVHPAEKNTDTTVLRANTVTTRNTVQSETAAGIHVPAVQTNTEPQSSVSVSTAPGNAVCAEQTAATSGTVITRPSAPAVLQGDFDLDGDFTLADGALANLIFYYELNELTDSYPLSAEQLQQADIIPGDTRGGTDCPLGEQEFNAINTAIRLKYVFGMSGLTVIQYLADQAYYDNYIAEHTPKEWENTQIDWSALGLPNPPTENDFLMAFSAEYAIAHSDHADSLTSDEIREIRTACRQRLRQYTEMKRENATEQELSAYDQLIGDIIRYTDHLHYQKYGTPGFSNTDPENSVIPSWDNISAQISEAKYWTTC